VSQVFVGNDFRNKIERQLNVKFGF